MISNQKESNQEYNVIHNIKNEYWNDQQTQNQIS